MATKGQTTPVTREIMTGKALRPNHLVKSQIETWKAEQRGEARKQRKVKELLNKAGWRNSNDEVVGVLSELTEFIIEAQSWERQHRRKTKCAEGRGARQQHKAQETRVCTWPRLSAVTERRVGVSRIVTRHSSCTRRRPPVASMKDMRCVVLETATGMAVVCLKTSALDSSGMNTRRQQRVKAGRRTTSVTYLTIQPRRACGPARAPRWPQGAKGCPASMVQIKPLRCSPALPSGFALRRAHTV